MENTLYEINKHKFNIISLANKLISTYNLNDEIFISNEIKKETEFLLSLLNIKNNEMMNQMAMNNNMNTFNPMMNPNFANYNNQIQQMMQQQLMQMQQMMQQQQMQQEIPYQQNPQAFPKEKIISLHFRKKQEPPITVFCKAKDRISEVIKQYRKISLNNDETNKFIFNAKALHPSLTVEEAGIADDDTIFVVETKGVRGG